MLAEALEGRRMLTTVISPLANVSVGSGAFAQTIDLRTNFRSSVINGTLVRFVTEFGIGAQKVTGNLDISLYDAATPVTVTNFLRYVNDGIYDKTFFHRLARDFVLQGGG